ncbi:MAG: Ig-like domain-containing protein, partial [Armatimonadetes bacterium]|nr:Ig-like domain-containing protein [Armatimonadota bacterium]
VTNCTITDNTGAGISIGATSTTNGAVVGATAAQAFGTNANTIQRNTGPGIAVISGSANRLSGNLINANNGLAIDLGNDGVTLNDGTTSAGSPNQLFDFPGLLPLELSGTTYTIAGTMPPNTTAVEIYQALDPQEGTPDPAPSAHHGEVDHRLARLATGSPGFDAAAGTFTVNVDSGVGDGFVDDAGGRLVLATAVALNALGDTSEFARNVGLISLGRSTVTVAPASIAADGTQTATAFATIRDAIDTPLQGIANVLITATPQGGGALPPTVTLDQDLNNDSVIDSTTDANGQVTAQLTATDRAGSPITIGATVDGTPLPPPLPTLTLLVGQPSATRSSIVQVPPNTPVTADGVSQAVLQITLLDGSGAVGAPVQGVPANQIQVIQVDGAGTELVTPTTGLTINQPTVATDVNGQTTATVVTTSADSDPGTPVRDPYRFSFKVNSVRAIGGSSIVVVDFVAGAVSASQSTFGANPTNNIPSDGTTASTLTLTVLDAQGNPLVGVPASDIVVTANPTDGLAITNADPSPTPVTDDAGRMRWTVTSTKPGTVTFVVTVRGTTIGQTPPVTFVVGSASGNSSLVANPLQARPNGTDVINLTATVLDGQGNPVPGVVVTITPVQGQGVSMVGPDQPTDANGVTRATATATVAGQVIFAATVLVGNVPTEIGRATVDFRNLQPSNSLSSLSVQTDDPLLANGQRQVTGTIRLVDTLSDPLRSVAPGNITVAVLDAGTGLPFAGSTVTGPNEATDSNGVTTFTVVSSQPGTVRIVVTVTGAPDVVLDDQPQVEFLPFITQTYGPGLHLMGLMGTPRQPDPRFVLSALLPDLRLARWDEGQQKYLIWSEFSPTAPFAMNPGRGFWLQLDSLVSFTAVADATPLTPFTLTLANGWNEVANPYPGTYTFSLADITVFQNGVRVGTLNTAAAQALVMPYGWRWDPVLQYLLVVDPSVGSGVASAQIGAGRGWWWLCRANGITVQLTPPAPGSRAVQPAPTPGQWSAVLTASTTGGKGEVMLGAGKTRLRAEAPPDALQPPAVRVRFVDALGRAASDLREAAPGQPQSWT